MQQRIEVKVTIKNDKGRSKAMQIVAGIEGVSSVTLGGEDKNILIVIGDGVDAVTLTQALIKKLGGATLVRVGPLNEYGRFDDQEEAAASMVYVGQSNNYGDYSYGQPRYSYYNSPRYPPPYYDQYYQQPDKW
ncbi:hypothetical protein DCAR_0520171 [Daucus carota subsp. sativus]|uniref:HMA domain-containing protein n=1 Tax=Daucus carota subsp. sativus TaxID=79200 RepID=A0AAF0X6Q5_DAUCS|nr:hypothetical protein DCAR_0520171 [Daucus carota subsp. sativus]